MKTSLCSSRCVRIAAVTMVSTISLLLGASAQDNRSQQTSQQGSSRNTRVRTQVGVKPKPAELEKISAKLTLSKPAIHANLTVYLLEGDDRMDTTSVLTLGEAIGKAGAVTVKETGSVNELIVENGGKKPVFIMAGDVVKGGQQDRTLGTDLTLGPKSGKIRIAAFCVEQGRWARRGREDVAVFSSSANAIVGNEGKLAVRAAKAQGEVWEKVAGAQQKLGSSLRKSVAQAASPSSLQLSLEDGDLKRTAADYAKAMNPIIDENSRAIGYVTVINGSVYSAEIFAGHDVFRRLWPKLIETTAIEAISEKQGKETAKPAAAEDVKAFLAAAEEMPATEEQIHGDFWSVSAIGKSAAVFQTVDKSKKGQWLRRSVLKK